MDNVKDTQLKKCIFLTQKEFERALRESLGNDVQVEYSLDGIWIGTDEDVIYQEEIAAGLSKYFDVAEVTSFHMDDCDEIGVWICYRDKPFETSCGTVTTREYDDGCARGIHVLLNDDIACSLDVYEPENNETEGEARILVYKKDYAEDEEEAPIACISINR